MTLVTALRLTILAACWLVGSLTTLNPTPDVDVFSPEAARQSVTTVEIGEAVSIETVTGLDPEVIVIDMAAFGCDSEAIRTFADGLIASGWRADLANEFGEALADPTGRVVVVFDC